MAEERADDVFSGAQVDSEGTMEKKRKRKSSAPAESEADELEIDISLPEPPSKKAKRKEKKEKHDRKGPPESNNNDVAASTATKDLVKAYFNSDAAQSNKGLQLGPKRSEHGIWIGNLPFTATRETLREFFSTEGGIEGRDVVRLHMPAPVEKGVAGGSKAQNKGFAYVDLTTKEVLEKALGLSEKLLSGRRLLIKNAKSFEGRPQKEPNPAQAEGGKKAPSQRIFVGNLGFDVGREELVEQFGQAGEVEDLHMATFEDSGKCKGFAWVRFATIEAAEAAVKGYVYRQAENEDEGLAEEHKDEGEDDVEIVTNVRDPKKGANKKGKKNNQRRKRFLNRLHGRLLRCEFAENAQTRYKKRYGKGTRDHRLNNGTASSATDKDDANQDDHQPEDLARQAAAAREQKSDQRLNPDKERRREDRRQRHDARTGAPGKALAGAQRANGAIVPGAGRKISFD